MIIPNKLLRLEYDPTKDVLFVEWPDFNEFALPEVNYTLDTVVETVRSYDIKKLLIDARKTVIALDSKTYEEVSGRFAKDLLSSRLKKLARLISNNSIRESQVQKFKEKVNSSFELESFATAEEALMWLSED